MGESLQGKIKNWSILCEYRVDSGFSVMPDIESSLSPCLFSLASLILSVYKPTSLALSSLLFSPDPPHSLSALSSSSLLPGLSTSLPLCPLHEDTSDPAGETRDWAWFLLICRSCSNPCCPRLQEHKMILPSPDPLSSYMPPPPHLCVRDMIQTQGWRV